MKKKVFNAMTIELQKRLSEIAGWVEEIKVDNYNNKIYYETYEAFTDLTIRRNNELITTKRSM